MKTLDTRDLYKRKCELEDLKSTLETAQEELQEAQTALDAHNATEPPADAEEREEWDSAQAELEDAVTDAEHAVEMAEIDFSTDEAEELAELEELESEISDFMHGETMIPERDFEQYAREYADDCCDMGSAGSGIVWKMPFLRVLERSCMLGDA
jgi:chromosome segregation ATPase